MGRLNQPRKGQTTMAKFYIAYDLDKPGQNYPELWNELDSLGAQRVQDSVWVLASDSAAKDLRDTLQQYIDQNDRLLVVQSAGSAWQNLMFNPTKLSA
jgi:CRISPR/Cas system-associated endoribonuclease Cas2